MKPCRQYCAVGTAVASIMSFSELGDHGRL